MVWLCNFPRGKVPLKDNTQSILTITAGRQTRYFSTGSPCGGPHDDQSYMQWDCHCPLVACSGWPWPWLSLQPGMLGLIVTWSYLCIPNINHIDLLLDFPATRHAIRIRGLLDRADPAHKHADGSPKPQHRRSYGRINPVRPSFGETMPPLPLVTLCGKSRTWRTKLAKSPRTADIRARLCAVRQTCAPQNRLSEVRRYCCKMLILIAGITGNIGSKLIAPLRARGQQVRGLGRNKSKLSDEQVNSLESFHTVNSWYDAENMKKALKGADAVICAYAPQPMLALEAQLFLVRMMEEEGITVSTLDFFHEFFLGIFSNRVPSSDTCRRRGTSIGPFSLGETSHTMTFFSHSNASWRYPRRSSPSTFSSASWQRHSSPSRVTAAFHRRATAFGILSLERLELKFGAGATRSGSSRQNKTLQISRPNWSSTPLERVACTDSAAEDTV